MLGTLHSQPDAMHRVLLRDDGRTKGIVRRKDTITPLVESQDYIAECRPWQKGDEAHWESEKFRNGWHRSDDTLFNSHAAHAVSEHVVPKMPDHGKQWLTAEPSTESKGLILVSRTTRYNNPHFPWKKLIEHFWTRVRFVGLKEEHTIFQNAYGVTVPYQPTKNLLELAQLIAGSDFFVGNQSVAMAIAEGLKHPRIQETCLWVPDCIYPPDGKNQYVTHGDFEIEDFKSTFHGYDVKTLDLREIPRGGWTATIDHVTENQSRPDLCAKYLARRVKLPYETVYEEVLRQNVARVPRFFAKFVDTQQFQTATQALRNAGWVDHPLLHMMEGDIPFVV